MDRTIHVAGAAASWLHRADEPWAPYFAGALFAVSLPVIALSVIATCIRVPHVRATRAAQAEGKTLDSDIQLRFEKRIQRVDRTMLMIALAALLLAGAVAFVDAYISAMALGTSVAGSPLKASSICELVLVTLGVATMFLAVMIFFPLAQLILVMYILTRKRKNGDTTPLSQYIPIARHISTNLCYTWAVTALMISVTWSPLEDTIIRDVFLVGAWGSATWWFKAAYAFNFSAQEISEKKIAAGNHGVRKVMLLFGESPRNEHDEEKGLLQAADLKEETDSLPPAYEEADVDAKYSDTVKV